MPQRNSCILPVCSGLTLLKLLEALKWKLDHHRDLNLKSTNNSQNQPRGHKRAMICLNIQEYTTFLNFTHQIVAEMARNEILSHQSIAYP
ncbi:hypothetical protein CPB83DRAFT_857072, partial [Crepidotus variabilis]